MIRPVTIPGPSLNCRHMVPERARPSAAGSQPVDGGCPPTAERDTAGQSVSPTRAAGGSRETLRNVTATPPPPPPPPPLGRTGRRRAETERRHGQPRRHTAGIHSPSLVIRSGPSSGAAAGGGADGSARQVIAVISSGGGGGGGSAAVLPHNLSAAPPPPPAAVSVTPLQARSGLGPFFSRPRNVPSVFASMSPRAGRAHRRPASCRGAAAAAAAETQPGGRRTQTMAGRDTTRSVRCRSFLTDASWPTLSRT